MMRIAGNNFLKTAAYTTMLGIVAWAVGSTYDGMRKNSKEFIMKTSQEVKTKDINRYYKIVNKITSGAVPNSAEMWATEAESMRDSLRVDSLCKKAYFEGAQMVRDSIVNTKGMVKSFK